MQSKNNQDRMMPEIADPFDPNAPSKWPTSYRAAPSQVVSGETSQYVRTLGNVPKSEQVTVDDVLNLLHSKEGNQRLPTLVAYAMTDVEGSQVTKLDVIDWLIQHNYMEVIGKISHRDDPIGSPDRSIVTITPQGINYINTIN